MGKKTLIGLIIVLGLGLRLVNLDQSFWLDEASQAQLSSMTVSQIWFERSADFHPPGFYLLSHYWLKLGTLEIWLRLLPVGFGVASIYLIFVFANKLFNDSRAGVIASFLLAINSYHVYYSQEFRMYSLLGLLGIWSMYLLYRQSKWLFFANALMLYTHYSSSLLLLTQVLWVFSFKRQLIRYLLIQMILTGLLYMPWVPQFVKQLQSGSNIDAFLPGWRDVLSISATKSLPLIIFKFIAGRINLLPRSIYLVYIVFVLVIASVAALLAKHKRQFLFSWLTLPIIASIFLSYLIPQTQPFRLIYTLPALILIFTQACMKFPKLFLTVLIYIAVVGNLLYFTRPRLQREQWRQAIEFLTNQQGSIVVKFGDKFAPFYWYAPSLPVFSATKDPLPNSRDIFLLEYLTGLTDPNRKVEQALEDLGYVNRQTHNYEGVGFIYHYQLP